MSKRTFTRRRFLKAGAALGAGWAVSSGWTALSRSRVAGANSRLNLAFVGVGGMGFSNLAIMTGNRNPQYGERAERISGTQAVALCDVDLERAARAFNNYPDAAKYRDYRKMLDEMEGDIDAVVVSTPDHVHAPASVTAMRMGKHVYCEKPGAHSVYETRVMADVAREQGVATQLGTQVHASGNFRRVVELIRAGAIGEVNACHIWRRSGSSTQDRPTDTPPIPGELDWDLWLGPAPRRPYHPTYVPRGWRRWWDFGGGGPGDMGCHYMDLPFWALDLYHAATIEADGPDPHSETAPGRLLVRYTFERGDDKPPVTLTWTHGRTPRAVFAEHDFPRWAWGVFVGDKGMLLADYNQHQLWPEADFGDYEPPEPSIAPSVGHRREWLDACRGEGEALCGFERSMCIAETVLLGNVAHRSGRKLEWNAEQFTIDNAHEAEGFLQRGYRPGWTL